MPGCHQGCRRRRQPGRRRLHQEQRHHRHHADPATLQKAGDLAAIFGGNLFSAQGAAAAIKSANLTGAVKIASFDAPEQAIEDLRNNVVDLVIAQQPALIGATAVQYAVDALNGKTAEIKKKVATPFVIITRENVDSPEAQGAIYKSE